MDLGAVELGDVDSICLSQDRVKRRALLNEVMNLWDP
jgi:hypothetical protein